MTVVAIDGKTIACDTQITYGIHAEQSDLHSKVVETDDFIFAYTGAYMLFQPWMNWFEEGRDPAAIPPANYNDNGITLWAWDGAVLYEVNSQTPYLIKIEHSLNALGTGREYAIGALEMGATAEEAVKIACKYDTNSGGAVKVFDLRLII